MQPHCCRQSTPFARRGADLRPASVPHRGATLIELLVVLVIIGILFSVAAFTLGGRGTASARTLAPSERIALLRETAIARGAPQTSVISTAAGVALVTALPDGRVLATLPIPDSGRREAGVPNAR